MTNQNGVVAATVRLHHVSGDKVVSLTRTLHLCSLCVSNKCVSINTDECQSTFTREVDRYQRDRGPTQPAVFHCDCHSAV